MTHRCVEIHVKQGLSLYHVGPSLDLGPLPSIFYLSLSGPDSLNKDPYNQFVQFLEGSMIRVFSLTLPGHLENISPKEALQTWADDFKQGRDPLDEFLEDFDTSLEFGLKNHFIDPHKISVAGLSRGGFLALHAAARNEKIHTCLAFAPIAKLGSVQEFHNVSDHPKIQAYDLVTLKHALIGKGIRIHIGNVDTLVNTALSFEFTNALAHEAKEKGVLSPQVEFLTHPSVGHKGHGTPPHIFSQGAEWIRSKLMVK